MTEHEALGLVRGAVATLGLAADTVELETDLRDDLGVDSIDLLDLLFELGERRGGAITLEELLDRQEPTKVRTIVACLIAAPPRGAADSEAGT